MTGGDGTLEREWMKVYRRVLPKCLELLGGFSGDRLRLASDAAKAAADRAVLLFAGIAGLTYDPFFQAVELRVAWLDPDDPAVRCDGTLRARLAWKDATPKAREAVFQALRDARQGPTMNAFAAALTILGALNQPYPGDRGGAEVPGASGNGGP